MKNKKNIQEQEVNVDENVGAAEQQNVPVEDNKVEALENELNESKDKYLRLAAEFDNFRRRTAKEKLDLIQTAGKDLITDLLEVLDDADRALPQIEANADVATKEGVALILNKFKNILISKGLQEMKTIREEFDPELHDAITEIPAPSPDLIGKVVDEITKGYYLNDKIIRHAKVVVGK